MREDLFIKTHRLNNMLVDHMLALFIRQWAFPEPSIQRLQAT
jgi:hypothetical protein